MMENRTKSEMAFIEGAGKLFALQGIDGVSIKAIGEVAGIDPSMIKYYFGNKDGLVEAVVEYATRPWRTNNLHRYYQENANLLETRDGQIIFVTGMVEVIFRVFYSGEEEEWARSFVLQLIQRPHPLRKAIIDRYIKPGVETFFEVYRKITGNDDFESAFCWYLLLLCPMYMYSGSPQMINYFHPKGVVSNGFERRLMHFTLQQLLSAFNLK